MCEVEEARERVIEAARRWVERSRDRKAGADHGQDDWYDAYAEDSQAIVDAVDALGAAEHAQPSSSDDDARSVAWAMGSAAAEETGEPPLPWREYDYEARDHACRVAHSLRDAGWVRQPKHH